MFSKFGISLTSLICVLLSANVHAQTKPGTAGQYYRQSQSHTIKWLPYTQESLDMAKSEDKPVIIDIGAVWSLPSQQGALGTYTDEKVAEVISRDFIAIKIDADEMPDVARRFAAAFELLNSRTAALPLTGFALPDGLPFDVMGSLPAEDSDGRIGLVSALEQAAQLYRDRKSDAAEQSRKLVAAIQSKLTTPSSGTSSSEISESTLPAQGVRRALYEMVDSASAGENPATASEWLLELYKNKVRDHILGGYFVAENADDILMGKPAYLQAYYMSANAQAFAATNKGLHKEAVGEVLRFCRDTLENVEGGFFSGQSATEVASTSADYYRWSREEVLDTAGDTPESRVLADYLNAPEGEEGLLHATDRLQKAADNNELSYAKASAALNATRKKLAEKQFEVDATPPVNKIILSGWSSDLIVAYLDAAELAGDQKAAEFALKSAAFLVEKMVDENSGLAHLYYQGEALGHGHFSDNVKFAQALLRCYYHTGEAEYLESAETVMHFVEGHFRDDESGLYRDKMEKGVGILATNALAFQSEPEGNPAAMAAINWAQIAAARKEKQAADIAERILKALETFGSTGFYAEIAALVNAKTPPLVYITSSDDGQLRDAALEAFWPYKSIVTVTANSDDSTPLKENVNEAIATVCKGSDCKDSTGSPDSLKSEIENFTP